MAAEGPDAKAINPDTEWFRQLLVEGTRKGTSQEWIQGIMRERDRHKQLNVPFPHQQKAVIEILAKGVEFYGLFHEMGLGKTVTCAMVIAARKLTLGYVPKTLVACPAGLVRHWKKDLLGWLRIPESKFLFVEKGSQLTHEAITQVDVIVVSRELVSKAFGECYEKVERAEQVQTDAGLRWVSAWLRRAGTPLHPLYGAGFRTETDANGLERRVEIRREFNLFFADEAHDLRNANSQRTQAFRVMSQACERRVAATGTPLMNRNSDIASQCLAMGAPTTPIDFTKTSSWVYKKDYNSLDERTNKAFMKHVNRATECDLKLPELVHTAVSYDVAIPEDKVDYYNDLIQTARDMRIAFERRPGQVTAVEVAKLMAILQEARFVTICPTIAEYGAAEMHKTPEHVTEAVAKPTGAFRALLAEMRQLQSEGHMRIIVASMHTSILRVVAKYLERIAPDLGKQYFYDGTMSTKKRDDSKYSFLNCRVGSMFLSIEAGGQGVHMVPGCEAMVLFGSTPWSNAQVDQVCKRIHRMGQTAPCTGSVQIRRLVPYGSVDAAISAVHGCKRRLQKMTVDKWEEATNARDGPSASKRRKVVVDDDDDDLGESTQAKWRHTGRIVDHCHKLGEDGQFPDMPLKSVNARGEETGVYTVIPGIITRGREGELPPDATPEDEPEDPLNAAIPNPVVPMGPVPNLLELMGIADINQLPPHMQAIVQQMMLINDDSGGEEEDDPVPAQAGDDLLVAPVPAAAAY